MWWLRLVGSLKLQVSFAEYRLFYRALLQERPIILRSLLMVATPYFILQFSWLITLPHTRHTLPHTRHTHDWVFEWCHMYHLIPTLKEYRLFYRALLQNIGSLIGLFCKRDLWFYGDPLSRSMWDVISRTHLDVTSHIYSEWGSSDTYEIPQRSSHVCVMCYGVATISRLLIANEPYKTDDILQKRQF